jgi:hypothetical protein
MEQIHLMSSQQGYSLGILHSILFTEVGVFLLAAIAFTASLAFAFGKHRFWSWA